MNQKLQHAVSVKIQMEREMRDGLDAMCAITGASRAELIRRAVAEYLKGNGE